MCNKDKGTACLLCKNITRQINRRGSNSKKWDECSKNYVGRKVLPLWLADSDFAAPESVLSVIQKRADHPVFGYASKPREFYKAAQDWFCARHNWIIEEVSMQTTPGVIPALACCVQAFTEIGDEVIIQPPVFPNFFSVVRNFGRKVVENPLIQTGGDFSMDFTDLKTKITPRTRLLILCNPQNPGGRVWQRRELEQLAAICEEYGIIVVSDELNCDLVFSGYKYTPFATVGNYAAENSVSCISPSKTFNLSGLSTSLIVAKNVKLRERVRFIIEGMGLYETNVFGVEALSAAYQHGGEWLDTMLCYLYNNARLLQKAIAQYCPDMNMEVPQSSFTAWLDCRRLGLTDEGLQKLFTDYSAVGVNLGTKYGEQGAGFVRLNFACSRETLMFATKKISDGLGKYFSRQEMCA